MVIAKKLMNIHILKSPLNQVSHRQDQAELYYPHLMSVLVKCFKKMDINKLNNIVNNPSEKSNKDLTESRDFLFEEYEKTKELIIDLTKHLESLQNGYEIINQEIGKRIKK